MQVKAINKTEVTTEELNQYKNGISKLKGYCFYWFGCWYGKTNCYTSFWWRIR
jgi:hypothetical protein